MRPTSGDPEALAQVLGRSHRLVFLGGAGVSTESGIPDFRSSTGLYAARREFGRAPEEILSADFFAADPETFFRYYVSAIVHPEAEPNPAHRALAALERRGVLSALVTQNIDGLHQAAGSREVLELHGSVLRNHCLVCGRSFTLPEVLGRRTDAAPVPRCDCGGIIKPDVVLYGETLPDGIMDAAARAVRAADTLVVGGTSLSVYPAAGLVQLFRGRDLVLINTAATRADSGADLVVREPIGVALAPFVDDAG
ncbi:MAG TPA: NAD-dependent protein deacylase [Cellulomonas sp.]